MPHILYAFVFPLLLALLNSTCENNEIEDMDHIVNPDDADENKDPEVPQDTAKVRRTVLMYVSAQNSLGYRDFNEQDSIEIVNGRKFIKENDRLLVYMDDENDPRIYRYTASKSTPEVVRTWDKDVNSSSPEILEEVLKWTKAQYPAEEYGMVMWSHSDGWLPSTNKDYGSSSSSTLSFGIDVGENGNMMYDKDNNGKIGAQMDIEDMATAIHNSGIHFKYIFFDSCLMQNLEVGYSLRNVTDYLIAAPIQIPGCGANYTHMLEKGLFTEAEYDIVNTYTKDATEGFDDYNNEYYDYGIVISSIKTDQLEKLAQTTADVLSRSTLMEKTSPHMESVLHYQAYTPHYFYRPHNYDAQEAMRKILNEKDFEKFKVALNEAVVSKGATKEFWIGPSNFNMQTVDLEKYSGVSMFIPQQDYSKNSSYCAYGDLNKAFQSTSWYTAAGWKITGW